MTTDRHDDQARDHNDILSDLQHTRVGFSGLGEVMDPDAHLEGQPRANISTLIRILTERFETLLEEVEHRWRSTPALRPEQPQEGDQHGRP